MQSVNVIECKNKGWFIMKFKVRWFGGESIYTGTFDITQTKTLDLQGLGLQAGDELWPVVNIIGGLPNFECGTHVRYDPGRGTARYEVGGTTLNPSCDLTGDSE